MRSQVEEIVLLPTEGEKQRRNENQIYLSLQNSSDRPSYKQHRQIFTR